MNNTVCSPVDVKNSIALAAEFPIDVIEAHLFQIEYYKFNTIAELGLELRNSMINDKIDYGLLPLYSPSTTYAINTDVIYAGKKRKSLQNANLGKMNTVEEYLYWGDSPIFNETKYNNLFPFLCRYISVEVLKSALAISTYSPGAQGATKYSEDFRGKGTGIITVDKEEFMLLRSSLISDGEMALSNLLTYLQSSTDFTPVTNLGTGFESANPAKRIGRRIFLKTKPF